jgi:GAF domain-containing protein
VLTIVFILMNSWAIVLGIQAQHANTERRHQICLADEREHLQQVDQLRVTYDYLSGLTDRQRRTALNRALLQQLPMVEKQANTDVAPEFCDEPNVGLPEPDPLVPERPPGLVVP